MRQVTDNLLRPLRLLIATAVVVAICTPLAQAQRTMHYFHAGNLPPGTVGQGQLARYLPLRGYTQPVEVDIPRGATVAVNTGGQFSELQSGRLLAGMQVGHVYQLQISNIPFHEGFEVYPTIEVINRLYPPEGAALRFPVPIQFTQEELELALSGRYVTRIVYLEDRETALPFPEDPERQRYVEAAPGQDPLKVADRYGRPMLIMRMGSRIPDADGFVDAAARAAPPVVIYPQPTAPPATSGDPASAIDRPGYNIPRVEVPRIGYPPQIPFATPPAQ